MEFIVQVPPSATGEIPSQIHYAIDLVGATGGHLTALVYEIDVLAAEEEDEAERGPSGELTTAQTATRERLQALAQGAGVAIEIVTGRNYAFTIGETLADYARLSDFTVLGVDGPLAFPHRHLAENVLFEAGRPLLLVPPQATFALDRVVVAWDSSRAASRAMHAAMPLLQKAGRVIVVSVGGDKEVRTGLSGAELTHRLARRGVSAEFHFEERGGRAIGDAFNDICGEVRADMLVMGAQRHSRLRDLVYGSVTHALFDRGPVLPVLLAN
ncbi:MAG TPA: universal stress protein [Saliniramus sp.]|nr:universal stress protein [Saliniramus sp.]